MNKRGEMTNPVCSEFSSFLRLLIGENKCRYFDDAKRLMRLIRDAAEYGLSKSERQTRINALSDMCCNLVRRLEADRSMDYSYRIPDSVRKMGIRTLDPLAKLVLLGNFELAVARFERTGKEQPRQSENPPGVKA
jgi:hypothetical protein